MKKKKKENKAFKIIISVLLVLSSLLLFYFINKLNVLEPNLLTIVGAILILIYAFILFKLFRKKTRKFSKVFFYILSIALIVVYFFAINYLYTTIKFVENMTGDSKEKQTYSVLVLKDSAYTKINDLNNKNIGFLVTNPNLQKAKERFNKITNLTYNEKDEDITNLIVDLNNKSLDAIMLDSSVIKLIEDNQKEFIENTKVIYTYTVYITNRNKSKKVDVTKDSFVFYISGSDTTDELSDNDRSDVNILAAVNPKIHKIQLVNIPRDYYVQLHGTTGTKDKLTHAGIYGVNMSVATIEDLFDTNINYYAKVSFPTLVNSVDVMGGIDITSDASFSMTINKEKCYIKRGTQHLNGNCALAFARERKSLAAGDYSRGENQQKVITAMINKLSNPSVLTKYNDILNAIDGSFETNMTYDEITSLVKSQLSSVSNWNIESTSVGGTAGNDYTYSMGNIKLYVTYPNEETIENAKDKINAVLYD